MNTATIHHSRLLPVLSLFAAGAAVTVGVVAITTDDVSSITPQPRPVVTASAVEAPPAESRAASGSAAGHAGDCHFVMPGEAQPC